MKKFNNASSINTLKVRNKNAILELLKDKLVNFEKISIVQNLKEDSQTQEILGLARKRNIWIEQTSLNKMAKRRSGETHEVLIAYILPNNLTNLKNLLDDLNNRNETPFFLLINRVDFDTNIGMIARTSYAAGVNGLIFQGDTEKFFNDDSIHYSVGAIARIPLIKMNIFEALKELKREDIKTLCLQMDGENYSNTDLKGPVAIILGEERRGITNEIAQRCDKIISIPMKKGIDSLNVSISASIVMYEKIRQDNL
ncbi:MAG: RNA methyltransferase [Candidatus Dojkabacteria bacterium]